MLAYSSFYRFLLDVTASHSLVSTKSDACGDKLGRNWGKR